MAGTVIGGSGAARVAGRALVVEFVGLPGAGKTTLARYAARWLRAHGLDVREPLADRSPVGWKRLFDHMVAASDLAARRPGTAADAGAALWSACRPRADQWAHLALNWCYCVRQAERARSNSAVVLVDQGPCQLLWSLGFRSGPERLDAKQLAHLAARIAPNAVAPDVVVLVLAPTEQVAARLVARDGRGDELSRAAARSPERAFARADATLEQVRAALEARLRVVVVENGRSHDVAETAAGLGSRLYRMAGGTRWTPAAV